MNKCSKENSVNETEYYAKMTTVGVDAQLLNDSFIRILILPIDGAHARSFLRTFIL